MSAVEVEERAGDRNAIRSILVAEILLKIGND